MKWKWRRRRARKHSKSCASRPSTTASNHFAVPGVLISKSCWPPVRDYVLGSRLGAWGSNFLRLSPIGNGRAAGMAQSRRFLRVVSRRTFRLAPRLLSLYAGRPVLYSPRGIPYQSFTDLVYPHSHPAAAEPLQWRGGASDGRHDAVPAGLFPLKIFSCLDKPVALCDSHPDETSPDRAWRRVGHS